MNAQRELFDTAATTDRSCPVGHCQAIRLAGQNGQIITCAHDLEHEHRKRPAGCLNAIDNSKTDFPEGF